MTSNKKNINEHRIIFIHNTLPHYRIPFFRKLLNNLGVLFVFTYLKAALVYNENEDDIRNKLKHFNYEIIPSHFDNIINEGIPFKLIPFLLKQESDIIVDNLQSFKVFLSFFISKIKNCKYIVWTVEWKNSKSSKNFIKDFITKVILKHSDGILVPGEKHVEYIESFGVKKERIFKLPNVSEIINDKDNKKIRADIRGKSKGRNIILFTGRLVRRKGVDYLLRSFYLLRKYNDNICLFIVGDGVKRKELEELSKKLKINEFVFFEGWVKQNQLKEYYKLADVCVVPSVTEEKPEPWGLVLNEAMSFATPVIATTAVGAAHEMICQGKNGYMVNERDEKELFLSLKRVIDSEEKQKKLADNAYSAIKGHFNYEKMLEKFMIAIEKVSSK